MSPPVVRAAGGVVWRDGAAGVEVLLVHRPRYDDWTFPKGKCEPDEGDEACACREVAEETGLRCEPGSELASARYVDAHGRDKVVRYWAMTVVEELGWEPGDEVDDLRWVSAVDAGRELSYARDVAVLDSFHQRRP